MTRREHRAEAERLTAAMEKLAKEYQDKGIHEQMMPILTWMTSVAQVHATLSLPAELGEV
jgi:hypothetical protein